MISTSLSPCPSVPAPGWTLANKEAGRVDGLLALDDGRCFLAGNFTVITEGGKAVVRPYAASFKGPTVGAFTPTLKSRAYDIAQRQKDRTVHIVGHGGYDVLQSGAWHNVVSSPLRSIALINGKVYLGEEGGGVRQLDGWRVTVGGSARTVRGNKQFLYTGSFDSQKSGTITKLETATGKKLPWADAHPKGPVLDIALSPDQMTLYAAIGGPGGTAAAYDTGTGKQKWFYVTDGNCQGICVLNDGTVIVGMHGDNVAPGPNKTMAEYGSSKRVPRKKVFALSPTGDLLPWSVNLTSNEGVLGVWALDASSQFLCVGGDFTHVNGVEHPRFAMFALS